MSRLIVAVVLISAVIFIGYQLLSFFISINNSSSQRRKAKEDMLHKLREKAKDLIPLDKNELALLSTQTTNILKTPGLQPSFYGSFLSIYNEPLVVFGVKFYGGDHSNKSTVICTHRHEFVYNSTKGKTEVEVDEQKIGVIYANGDFHDMKDRFVAHIEVDSALSSHPVKIRNREVGEIINPIKSHTSNARAFTFLEEMDEDEKIIFMGLTLLALVEESL